MTSEVSLYLSSVLMTLFAFFASIITWKTSRSDLKGTGFWTLGYVFYLFSIFCVILKASVSESLYEIAAHSFEALGSVFQLLGFAIFFTGRISKNVYAVVCMIFILNGLGAFLLLHGQSDLYSLIETINNLLPSIGILLYSVFFKISKNHFNNYVSITFGFISLILFLNMTSQLTALFSPKTALAINTWGFFGPVSWILLVAILVFSQHHMANKKLRFMLKNRIAQEEQVEKELREVNKQLSLTNIDVLYTLVDLLESRTLETSDHAHRVSLFTRVILDCLEYNTDDRQLIIDASTLHDIGKVGMKDILLKSSSIYTEEERIEMQQHTRIGYDILSKQNTPLLRTAAIIALEHHENWDGSGYPLGKKGLEIAFSSRVVSIADAFDALVFARMYKEAWTVEQAIAYLLEQSGVKFDPEIVSVISANTLKLKEALVIM